MAIAEFVGGPLDGGCEPYSLDAISRYLTIVHIDGTADVYELQERFSSSIYRHRGRLTHAEAVGLPGYPHQPW